VNTEQRIARLEYQNRVLRAAFVSVVIALSCATLIGANGPQAIPDRIEAKEFVLVDKDGKERGALRVVERTVGSVIHQGPYLLLTDSKGTIRAEFGCKEGNSINEVDLDLKDKDGNTRIGAHAQSDAIDQATIFLRHKSGARVDVTASTKLADVVISGDAGLAPANATIFATPDARGIFISDVKETQPGVVKTIPEFRMTHEGGKNKLIIYDSDGDRVWKKP
jgi:hypothetical protein